MNLLLIASIVTLGILILTTGFLLLGALRTISRLSWRLDQLEATTPGRLGRGGLNPGAKAPEFTLPSVAGGDISLRDFAGRPLLLVFSQPHCAPCHDVVPDLNKIHQKGEVDVVVICNGDAAAVREWTAEVGARVPVLGQENWKVSKKYEVFATPFAFVVDGKGIIQAKGIASKADHLGFLFESARNGAQAEKVGPVSVPAAMAPAAGS